MPVASHTIPGELYDRLRHAARVRGYIEGLTHGFYPYPARFPPEFAAAAIESFTAEGETVLDPYMGGGTTIVEAMAHGRRAIGCDINSLSLFLVRVKTTPLSWRERTMVKAWADRVSISPSYRAPSTTLHEYVADRRATNLSLRPLRALKKAIAVALRESDRIPSRSARSFTRGVILRAAQRALDGRRHPPSLAVFRSQIAQYSSEMLVGLSAFSTKLARSTPRPALFTASASALGGEPAILACGDVDLVVTSPPYPGVHVLYHRWQVMGGRETPAPYWIANCQDGCGESYYNFGDRRESRLNTYFSVSLATLNGIRRVVRRGAHMVQLVAFANPRRDLPRYLRNMEAAGFAEVRPPPGRRRIWRSVPRRKWHASMRGSTLGTREVLLIHRAS